ncbi:MAG: DUF418 domain-containing protein [Bacteroidales bacterium]
MPDQDYSHHERIVSLDVLRGVAVAGILIMNIQSFSMPSAAYLNPTVYGDLTGVNRWVWIISHLLASGKFISIFSMLFGAGVLIFIRNVQSRGEVAMELHFRRMAWLLLFGMVHAYLFWQGDILVTYALCGMGLWFFRNMKPGSLLQFSVFIFLVPIVLATLLAHTLPYWPNEAVEAIRENWNPNAENIRMQVEGMKGNWLERMKIRVPETLSMQSTVFMAETAWRVLSMMLLGMFLLKKEILTGGQPRAIYIRMALIGLFTGYLLSAAGVWLNFHKAWSLEYSMFIGSQFNYAGSIAVALGYTGVVMLIVKSDRFRAIVEVFSALGRTAFSNYILQTLICITIFYGNGLGLFGSVQRKYQLLIVIGVWLLQVVLTRLWLGRFRQGPLEWFWRRLTYRQEF